MNENLENVTSDEVVEEPKEEVKEDVQEEVKEEPKEEVKEEPKEQVKEDVQVDKVDLLEVNQSEEINKMLEEFKEELLKINENLNTLNSTVEGISFDGSNVNLDFTVYDKDGNSLNGLQEIYNNTLVTSTFIYWLYFSLAATIFLFCFYKVVKKVFNPICTLF